MLRDLPGVRCHLIESALLCFALSASASLLAVPTTPARAAPFDPSVSGSHEKKALKAGQFVWYHDPKTASPSVIVVSLSQQLAYVYGQGELLAMSTISSGRRGYETPTGTFTILQRQRMHHSNLYDDAPMPFMLRLTWGGVAMHGGRLPGYRASHGCIRLPMAFSRQLYDVAPSVVSVIVMDDPMSDGIFDGRSHRLNTSAGSDDLGAYRGPSSGSPPPSTSVAPESATHLGRDLDAMPQRDDDPFGDRDDDPAPDRSQQAPPPDDNSALRPGTGG